MSSEILLGGCLMVSTNSLPCPFLQITLYFQSCTYTCLTTITQVRDLKFNSLLMEIIAPQTYKYNIYIFIYFKVGTSFRSQKQRVIDALSWHNYVYLSIRNDYVWDELRNEARVPSIHIFKWSVVDFPKLIENTNFQFNGLFTNIHNYSSSSVSELTYECDIDSYCCMVNYSMCTLSKE